MWLLLWWDCAFFTFFSYWMWNRLSRLFREYACSDNSLDTLALSFAETARVVDSVPVFTSLMELLMRFVVFCAASADLAARLLTSSATMEKPAPAVPAREASTEAFNAKIFVWNA